MSKLLIFGGTTEGRSLAEFCAANAIPADVSSATDQGAALLPEQVGVLRGRRSADEILELLQTGEYSRVIDATHPYASEVTQNIQLACHTAGIPCDRLIRKPEPVTGEAVKSLSEMIDLLNTNNDSILSTLGSKSVEALTAVRGYSERIWLRLLPSDTIRNTCSRLGYDPEKIILANGPFDIEENILHIRRSKAAILLTKESGAVGGYPEKAAAAAQCGIRMITLCRPPESGYSYDEITKIILQLKRNHLI